jgi:hypothetical protein
MGGTPRPYPPTLLLSIILTTLASGRMASHGPGGHHHKTQDGSGKKDTYRVPERVVMVMIDNGRQFAISQETAPS